MRQRHRQSWTVLGIVVLLVVSTTGGAAATTATGTQQTHADSVDAPAFVVDLQENGSATVTVSYTYDLSDTDRKDAFEDLRNSTAARSDFRDRFESRFRSVANNTANETGQEMSVGDATLDFRTEGDTGIVTASVQWHGLAAVDGDQLTVTEPFASGFTTERAFHVVVPDGYAVTSVEPTADQRDGNHLTWTAGADLDGFELVTTASENTETMTPESNDTAMEDDDEGATVDSAGSSGPGFGIVAVVVALAGLLALARRD